MSDEQPARAKYDIRSGYIFLYFKVNFKATPTTRYETLQFKVCSIKLVQCVQMLED